MDFRPILLIIIVAGFIWYYFNLKVTVVLAALGILTAIVVFIYILLRGEGKTKSMANWRRKMWKKYLKFEDKLFKWIDSI